MKFFNKLAAWLEKRLMPIASKIGNQRHLVAMRDGFIATLPISLAGSMAVLFNSVLFKEDSLIGKGLNKLSFYADNIQPFVSKYVVNTCGQIWWATLAITTLFMIFTISYNLAKSYDIDPLSGAIVAVASFFALMNQLPEVTMKVNDVNVTQPLWGWMNVSSFNSTAIFTGLIVALLATELFVKITKKGWTIKLPEQVPPAVSKAFASVIPGFVTILVFSIVGTIFVVGFNITVKAWIEKTIQTPLVNLGQSPVTYIFLVLLSQLLWFFGLHGLNMIEPALITLYMPSLNANMDAAMLGKSIPYTLTRNFVDVYASFGGSGCTLGLIIAIFLFSKREEQKELAKLAVAPGTFQINEPVIFGLPLVLNPIMFIPFVFTPALLVFIAWFFTEIVPFAARIQAQPAWVTPPVLNAFLATNGDWKATVLAAALLALSVVIYAPFVIASNKMNSEEA